MQQSLQQSLERESPHARETRRGGGGGSRTGRESESAQQSERASERERYLGERESRAAATDVGGKRGDGGGMGVGAVGREGRRGSGVDVGARPTSLCYYSSMLLKLYATKGVRYYLNLCAT
jgi:hypothetical protein